MFCCNCGKNIEGSMSFCPNCGFKNENLEIVNNANINNSVIYNTSTKDGTLKLLDDVYSALIKYEPSYCQLDNIVQKNEELKMKNGKSKTNYVTFLTLACSFLFMGIPIIFARGMLVIGILLTIAGLVLLGFAVYFRQDYKLIKVREQEIEDNEKSFNNLLVKINNEVTKENVFNYYPMDYFDSFTINSLRGYLIKARADSLKEAINLYETELYQERMEFQQGRLLSLQKETLDATKNIEDATRNIDKNTKKAANAARAGAVFSGISAYNTHKIRKKF